MSNKDSQSIQSTVQSGKFSSLEEDPVSISVEVFNDKPWTSPFEKPDPNVVKYSHRAIKYETIPEKFVKTGVLSYLPTNRDSAASKSVAQTFQEIYDTLRSKNESDKLAPKKHFVKPWDSKGKLRAIEEMAVQQYMRNQTMNEVFKGTYMLDALEKMEAAKGYGHNLKSSSIATNFEALQQNTDRIFAENKIKQKNFNEERDKTGVKPNLDIPGSFRSMANTSNNIVYDIKKKSFANTCKAEISKYNAELCHYFKVIGEKKRNEDPQKRAKHTNQSMPPIQAEHIIQECWSDDEDQNRSVSTFPNDNLRHFSKFTQDGEFTPRLFGEMSDHPVRVKKSTFAVSSGKDMLITDQTISSQKTQLLVEKAKKIDFSEANQTSTAEHKTYFGKSKISLGLTSTFQRQGIILNTVSPRDFIQNSQKHLMGSRAGLQEISDSVTVKLQLKKGYVSGQKFFLTAQKSGSSQIFNPKSPTNQPQEQRNAFMFGTAVNSSAELPQDIEKMSDGSLEVKNHGKAKFTLVPVKGAAMNLAIDIARQCNTLYNSDRIKSRSPIRSNQLDVAIERASQDKMQVFNSLVKSNDEYHPSVHKMFLNDQITEVFKTDVTKREVEMEYRDNIADGKRMAAQIEHQFHILAYPKKAGIKQMAKNPPTVFKRSMMKELKPIPKPQNPTNDQKNYFKIMSHKKTTVTTMRTETQLGSTMSSLKSGRPQSSYTVKSRKNVNFPERKATHFDNCVQLMDFSKGSKNFESPNRSKCQLEPLHGQHRNKLSQVTINEIMDMKRKSMKQDNSEIMDKATLYYGSINSKIDLNREIEKNRKMRHDIVLLQQKLRTKDKLVQDSLNCTFVACPCSVEGKHENTRVLFKLRRKIMELRDLCCLQECQIIKLQQGDGCCNDGQPQISIRDDRDDSELIMLRQKVKQLEIQLSTKPQSQAVAVVDTSLQMELTLKLQTVQSQLTQLQSQLDRATQELKSNQTRYNQLEHDLSEANQKYRDLQESSQKQIRDKDRQISDLNKELVNSSSYKKRLDDLQVEYDRLSIKNKEEVSKYRLKIDEFKKSLIIYKGSDQEIKSLKEKWERERENFKKDIQHSDEKREKLERELQELREKYEKLKESERDFGQRLKVSEQTCKSYLKEVETWKQKYSSFEQSISVKMESFEKVRLDYESLLVRIKELEASEVSFQHRLMDKEIELKRLRDK